MVARLAAATLQAGEEDSNLDPAFRSPVQPARQRPHLPDDAV